MEGLFVFIAITIVAFSVAPNILKEAERRSNTHVVTREEYKRLVQEAEDAKIQKYTTFVTFDNDETVYMAATRYQNIQIGERVAAVIDGTEKWGTIVENTKDLNYSAVNPKLLIEVKRYEDTEAAKQKKSDKAKHVIITILVIAFIIGFGWLIIHNTRVQNGNTNVFQDAKDQALRICETYNIENATANFVNDGVDGSFQIYKLVVRGDGADQYTQEKIYSIIMCLKDVEVDLPMTITTYEIYFDGISYSAYDDRTLYIDHVKYDLDAEKHAKEAQAELEKYSALSKPEEGMPEKYIGVTGYGEPSETYTHIGIDLGSDDYVEYYWYYSNGDLKAIATVNYGKYKSSYDSGFDIRTHRNRGGTVTSVEFYKKTEKKTNKNTPSKTINTYNYDDDYGRGDYGSAEDFYEDFRDEFDNFDDAEDFFDEYYDG